MTLIVWLRHKTKKKKKKKKRKKKRKKETKRLLLQSDHVLHRLLFLLGILLLLYNLIILFTFYNNYYNLYVSDFKGNFLIRLIHLRYRLESLLSCFVMLMITFFLDCNLNYAALGLTFI